jgi:chemotaxis protein methyltransferase CheR
MMGAHPSPDPFAPQGRMSRRVAAAIVERLKTVAGIRVDPKNQQFLTFRLDRRLQALGLDSYEAYLEVLESPSGEAETARLVESLVTHTTSFFREPAHFDWMEKTGLPTLNEAGAGRLHPLTVWSAACSTGPELWSAGMVLDRFSQTITGGLRWGMVGSDISAGVLRRAAGAIFTATELAGVNEERKRQYFLRSRPGVAIANGQRLYRVAPELRNRASFAQGNLLQELPDIPLADIIFLRNVLIYFAPDDRQACLNNVTARLRQGGYLILGHSDSHHGLPPGMTACGPSIFRKG